MYYQNKNVKRKNTKKHKKKNSNKQQLVTHPAWSFLATDKVNV